MSCYRSFSGFSSFFRLDSFKRLRSLGGGFFLLFYLLSYPMFGREGLGFGDVKLMAVSGLLLGLTMDCAMGAAGINTIATLPVAFFRPQLAAMICGRENIREGGIPSPERLGSRKFFLLLLTLTLIHHTIFFLLEALSWSHLLHTLLRIVVSSALSVAFGWIIVRIFTAKLPVRI